MLFFEVQRELSEKIRPLIGHGVATSNIFSDKFGWGNLPANSLQNGNPVVAVDYHGGMICIIIPHVDWVNLELEKLTIDEYIADSTWSFGSYEGGYRSNLFNTFEPTGISKTSHIKQFLTETRCRVMLNTSGHLPDDCCQCNHKHCSLIRHR